MVLSEEKLLTLIKYSAMSLIPTDGLSERQKDRLDNIYIEFCNCTDCVSLRAHTNKRTLKIGISETQFKKTLLELTLPGSLLMWISTIIHEIVHIIHPRLNEAQTEKKTWQYFAHGIKEMGRDFVLRMNSTS